MTITEIKQQARNLNRTDIYIAIENLCDYVAELEKTVEDLKKSNQQSGETERTSKKKGSN